MRFIITILTAVFFSGGCYNEPTSQHNGEDGQTDSTAYRLYATYYSSNYENGVLIIDPLSLTVLDTIQLNISTYFIRISNDSNYFYLGEILDFSFNPPTIVTKVHKYNIETIEVIDTWDVPGDIIEMSSNERYLFINSSIAVDTFWVYDTYNKEIIYKDSTFRVWARAFDPDDSGFYVMYRHADSTYGTNGIFHFDPEVGQIDRFYEIGTVHEQREIIPDDLVTTHDGSKLMFTYMTTDLFNDARLRVINTETGEIETTIQINGQAKLAITNNDDYVYIADSGLWELDVSPSGIIRKYDVNNQTVEFLIDMKNFIDTPHFNIYPLANQPLLFSRDSLLALSSIYPNKDFDLMVWNLNNKTLIGTLQIDTTEVWTNIYTMILKRDIYTHTIIHMIFLN